MNISARTVIVGIDLSSTSDLALDWGATEAVRLGVPLVLLHAYSASGYPAVRASIPGGPAISDLDETLRDTAEKALATAADRARGAHPGLLVEAIVRAGLPGAILVEASRDAELVVVGARGLGAVKGMLFGSVSTHVCAHAHAPVVVVHKAASRSIDDARVVVGVDGSETSQAALAFGFAQASSRGVGLTVVHTWQIDGVEGTAASLAWSVDWAQIGEEERSVVAEAMAGFGGLYPDVDVRRHVTQGSPIGELARLSQGACLVVVGTRGRGTVSGWLKGVRLAVCSARSALPRRCCPPDAYRRHRSPLESASRGTSCALPPVPAE